MYRRLQLSLVVATAVLAAIIAGCGGGSGGATGAQEASGGSPEGATATKPIQTSSLTKAQFLKRANAICGRTEGLMQAGIHAYEKQHPETANQTEAKKVTALTGLVLVPVMQKTIDEVRELGAPRGDEKQVEAILDTMQAENEGAEKNPVTGQRVSSFYQYGEEFKKSDKLAAKYGLDACTYSF